MATPTAQSDIKDNGQTGMPNASDDPASDADISTTELELLDNAGTDAPGDDNDKLMKSQLDNRDNEGAPLNEADDFTGDDLDVPGSKADDYDESIGEEDEENNSYSLSDQDDTDDGEPIY